MGRARVQAVLRQVLYTFHPRIDLEGGSAVISDLQRTEGTEAASGDVFAQGHPRSA